MAERHLEPDTPELRARWGQWTWTAENTAKAQEIIARYPEGRQRSAVMALLDYAQRQVGEETGTQGWLPIPVMEYVAKYLDMPIIRVVEVASFYTMYNLVPVGRYHVQVCGTTPCMLRGSDEVLRACKDAGGLKGYGDTSADGLFTMTEVECLGGCVNAPILQVDDDYYEDMDYDSTVKLIEALKRGERPPYGSSIGRQTSAPEGGPNTLTGAEEG